MTDAVVGAWGRRAERLLHQRSRLRPLGVGIVAIVIALGPAGRPQLELPA